MKVGWQTYGPLAKNQAAIVWQNDWTQRVARNLIGGAAFGFGLAVAVVTVALAS